MKNLILIFLFSMIVGGLFAQNAKVSGTIINGETLKPVENATITIGEQQANTNDAGFFEINDVPKGKTTIVVEAEGMPKIIEVLKIKKEELNIGELTMGKIANGMNDIDDVDDNVVSGDFLDDEDGGGAMPSILSSSKDVYASAAAYTFGHMFYRMRGYDNNYTSTYLNGVSVQNPEQGRASWSAWGGLNDVTRNKDTHLGITAGSFGFGDIGGSTNIITRPSTYRKQKKFSYSMANRSYRQRVMGTYSSGLNSKGWAFMASASRRWANEGYVEGTFYDGFAYFAAAEKKLNDKNSITLTTFGSPTARGVRAASTQEANDLAGSNYYNPNWGWQEGEKRNAKEKYKYQPMTMLSHFFDAGKTKITSTLAYSFGTSSYTSLNWYNAYDPRPDYYRLLPSYVEAYDYGDDVVDGVAEIWQDESVRQIDWDELYYINYISYYNQGQDEKGQARYMIEDRRSDHKRLNLSSNISHLLTDNITLSGGFELSRYTVNHYKLVDDLLETAEQEGDYYWIDVDQFAERDFPGDPDVIQNDLNNPDRVVYEGDRFGYDYDINVNSENAWGQSKFIYDNIEFYAGANIVHTQFWREGHMKNGRAPNNSFGESTKNDYLNFGVKGGLTIKIAGSHYLSANGLFKTNAPTPRNSYMSPRIKDDLANGLTSEKIQSADISYTLKKRKVSAKITAFHTTMLDQTTLRSFYHDGLKSYVNYSMTGIDAIHKGIEFGTTIKLAKDLSIFAAGNIGDYKYMSDPTITLSVENGSQPDSVKTVIFTTEDEELSNYYVPGIQVVGSVGLKYNINYWFFEVSTNYIGRNYLSYNPDLRTQEILEQIIFYEDHPTEPSHDDFAHILLDPQRMPDQMMLNASIGKSIRINYKYFININFSISNILDNQSIITGGYEQSRFDPTFDNLDKFPSKRYYSSGRAFFLNLSFRI